jgi:sugar lactone lactonase YvrE
MRTRIMIMVVCFAGVCLAARAETHGRGFLLEQVGFATPESVLYDPQADEYLVANINGSPLEKDDNGFISRVSPAGEIVALKWIDGANEATVLHAPKGMAFSGDMLYIADIDSVRIFARGTGAPAGAIAVIGARFLNDVAADSSGDIFVSDNVAGRIHRITAAREVKPVAPGASLGSPNGLAVHGTTLYCADMLGQVILAIAPGSAPQQCWRLPAGGLDGLIMLEDGSALVSSWQAKAVYRCLTDGSVREIITGVEAPADIGFDVKRNLVLIPHFMGNRIEARPLPE